MSLSRCLPLLLAGGIGLFGGMDITGAVRAETPASGEVIINTDLTGAQDLARRALAEGRPDLTVLIARQILAAVPEDVTAHLLLAAGLTRVGDPKAAAVAAKAGFRLAEDRDSKFEGAFLTAEALSAGGRTFGSKLWLRRADAYASSDAAKAVLRQAYGSVAAQSPLTFGLSVFAGPSENVNGGSEHDTFFYFGIPIPISQALPGWSYGGAVNLSYALSPTDQVTAQWTHRSVVFNDTAKALQPGIRAADYAQDELGLGYQKVWLGDEGRQMLRFSASVGRQWTGGKHNADVAAVDLSALRTVSDNLGIGLRLGVEQVTHPDRPAIDSTTWAAGVILRPSGERLGSVSVDLGAQIVDSDAAGIAWRGPTLSLGWAPALDSDVIGVSFTLAAQQREYWKTPSFDPDIKLGVSATAELKTLEVMGFSPTVTVSSSRTWSDLVVRDTKDLGVSFGLSSSF